MDEIDEAFARRFRRQRQLKHAPQPVDTALDHKEVETEHSSARTDAEITGEREESWRSRTRLGLGLHMEFHAGGQWIITSHVRAIAVEPSAAGRPC